MYTLEKENEARVSTYQQPLPSRHQSEGEKEKEVMKKVNNVSTKRIKLENQKIGDNEKQMWWRTIIFYTNCKHNLLIFLIFFPLHVVLAKTLNTAATIKKRGEKK